MNRLLIVSATQFEVKPFMDYCSDKNISVQFLITGVGIHAVSFHLTQYLSVNSMPNFVIQAGIAGSFNPTLNLGEVVNVNQDTFADLGMFTEQGYQSVFENQLIDSNSFPFINGVIHSKGIPINSLTTAKGITVNTCSNEVLAKDRHEIHNADTESMEGAAFFYVCSHFNVSFAQIRAISNRVGEVNRNNWNIALAVQNLNNQLIQIYQSL